MTRDLEAELRRSLQTRAGDVSPDPALYARVQVRIRRGRSTRFALAGLAGALAVTGVAVAAPRLTEQRVEFEPPAVASQPPGEPTGFASEIVSPRAAAIVSGPLVFTDGGTVFSMALDGESAEIVVQSPCPEDSMCDMEPRRAVTAAYTGGDEFTIVVAEGCNGLLYTNGTGDPQPMDTTNPEHCVYTATFSPDGTHLAWTEQETPDAAKATLHVVNWTSEGPGDDRAAFELPWADAHEVRIQDWEWTENGPTTRGYLVVRARRNDVVQLLKQPIERQPDGAIATTRQAPLVSARAGFAPLAYAEPGGTGVTHTLEARLAEDGFADGTVVRRIGTEIDAEIPVPDGFFEGRAGEGSGGFDESGIWMSDAGGAVVLGTGAGKAWYLTYGPTSESSNSFRAIQALATHGTLLPPNDVERPIDASATPAPARFDVYFGMTGADACVADQPVARTTAGKGVARAALTELLKGPTSRESNEGIASPFTANTAEALNDIAIVDGQARVDFADFSADVGNDSCTKLAILDALDQTLMQFPTITSTRYSFDGDVAAFQTWSGTGPESPPAAPAAVQETADQVLEAARAEDWEALRQLSKGSACTMSDQPKPCVPYWKDQQAQGEDPLVTLTTLLSTEGTLKVRTRGPVPKGGEPRIWVWPEEWADQFNDYNGPRIGIDADGTWLYFVQGGG